MMAAVARALMTLAASGLGDRRREWGRAMQAEFEVAQQDGKSLSFAIGCLIATCRDLPTQEEGRFALASHLFALAILVPLAALMVSSVLNGFPASYPGHFGLPDLLGISGEQEPLLNPANQSAAPSLVILVLVLAVLNLRMAWLALDRDWVRLTDVGFLSAATTTALFLFSAVVFVQPVGTVAQVAVLAIEWTAALVLARWHSQLCGATPAASTH